MKSLLFSILICLLPGIALSQSISGKVVDTQNKAIPLVTISLSKENSESIIDYASTDSRGIYRLKINKPGKYIVRANYLGYQAKNKEIVVENGLDLENIDFILEEGSLSLQEITIKDRYTGINFKDDTIRYNPKVFTDGSEAVLEDVLKKLPGIEVDPKGNIKVQGKDVSKVLMNGQDFFGKNTQMATKQLPADIAETVEVVGNYSEYNLLSGFQSREQTVINIGVNKNKLGKISGQITAGGGIEDKYNAKGNLMRLGSRSMLSLLSSYNNTGEEVFSMEDYIKLQGGIMEFIGGNKGRITLSQEETALLLPQNNTHTRSNGISALNVSCHPSSKFKLNAYFLFNNNKSDAEDLSRYLYDLPSGSFTVEERSKSTTKNHLFSGQLKVDYFPSQDMSFAYKGTISNSGMERSSNAINFTSGKYIQAFGDQNADPFRTQHDVMFMKALGKNVLLANAGIKYDNSPNNYDIQTDSLLLPIPLAKADGWYYGEQYGRRQELETNISSALFVKLHEGFFLRATIGAAINTQKYISRISEDIPEMGAVLLDDTLQNNNRLQIQDYYGGLEFIKNNGLIQFKLGATGHLYSSHGGIANRLDKNTTSGFTPLAELTLQFSQSHSLSASFSRSVFNNAIASFSENMIFDNYRSYREGSSFSHLYNSENQITLRYNLYDLFYNTTIVFIGSYTKRRNTSTSNILQRGVLSISNTVDASPFDNLRASFYLNKGLGFIPWVFNLRGAYNNSNYYSFLSGSENKVTTQKIGGEAGIESNSHFPLNFACNAKIDFSTNHSTLGSRVEQTVQSYSGKLKWKPNTYIYIETELEYMKNSLPSDSRDLYSLNATIRYTPNKKVEFQLKGMNIVNIDHQEWSNIIYTPNYSVERFYRQLPGYILFSASYRF
jgi:hypothetical protein